MLLSQILHKINKPITGISHKNKKINDICLNSKKTNKGDLFISLKGKKYKGNFFIEDAIKRKTSAIITDTKLIKNYV